MKQLKLNYIYKHRFLFISIALIAILLSWYFLSTFSSSTSDSGWDGVVASSFASGTGSEENPYVISTAGEFAYFKQLLESDEATFYADKNYLLTSGFNYGKHELSIDSDVPFSGTLDGQGNTIYNVRIFDSLFSNLENASIVNLSIKDIDYQLTGDKGAILALSSNKSNLDFILIEANVQAFDHCFGGLFYEDDASKLSQVVLQENVVPMGNDITTLIYHAKDTQISNVLVKNDVYDLFKEQEGVVGEASKYMIQGDRIVLEDSEIALSNDTYEMKVHSRDIALEKKQTKRLLKALSPSSVPSFEVEKSGSRNQVIYINDLDADWNYYQGLNYVSGSSRLPTGENRNIYSENNLVRAKITYSASDGEYTGTISDTENEHTMVYYKWLEVKNNQVDLVLIDNPFTNRPNGKGFNGWVSQNIGVVVTLDSELYQRHASIPVTRNENGYNDLVLNFRASWVDAQTADMTGSWSNVFSNFYSEGLHEISTSESHQLPFDMVGYYVYTSTTRNHTYTGYYRSGNSYRYATDRTCTSKTCYYYRELTSGEMYYNEDDTFYYFENNRRYTVYGNDLDYDYEVVYPYENKNMGGYYVNRDFSNGASYSGYYDLDGNRVNGTCRSSSCTYYELLGEYDENEEENLFEPGKHYYYLTTRDTNIAYIGANIYSTWSTNQNKPFTFTGLKNGERLNYRWNVNSLNVTAYNDTTIENLTIYSENEPTDEDPTTGYTISGWSYIYHGTVIANFHNLKVGRGLRQYEDYANFDSFIGGLDDTGSNANNTKYSMIIESGVYSSGSLTEPPARGNRNTDYLSIQADAVYGSDVDRIKGETQNLDVSFSAAGSWAGEIRSTRECAIHLTVKSGSFGTGKYDMYSGIYVGGRSYGEYYSARCAKIEGGYIYNLIGGPLTASSRASYNDTYIYQTGGTIDMVVGGAGRSATYGNRIISLTGGTVNYSVFGGSNGSGSDSSDGDGTLNGSSFIYVGGNATIGNGATDTLFGAESGSVFGNGNGKSGYSAIGSNENSYILIDGNATIKNSVYGGGNYGATGVSSSKNTTTTSISILGGTVEKNVYGGGNQNGAGTDDTIASITITQKGGTVKGSIYGGSNISGTILGSTKVQVQEGNVETNIYGGGKGVDTYVKNDVEVVIGDRKENVPVIGGSVYGGSAFGTVNSTSHTGSNYGNTSVTVNQGVVLGSVFGGGEGDASTTPYVLGDINVTIQNGDITSVFGGNDQAGTHTKKNEVFLNGGVIGSAFGGGNKSSVENTHVHANGSSVTTLFGGSNSSGDVTSSTVEITGGEIGNAYGGNNEGGSCDTTSVKVEGVAKVLTAVYGGGNKVSTPTTDIQLLSADGTIPNVYGGGNLASVTTTNILQNGANVGNIFGGSNNSGSVQDSFITHVSGTSTNVYGGNNAGGNTVNTHITFQGGTSENVYGGGYQANSDVSHIEVSGGTSTNIFGGGNKAGLSTSNILVTSGNVVNVYGGSNNSGLVSTTNVVVNNSNNISSIYGGGNKAEVGITNVIVNGGKVGVIFGGGNLAQVNENTYVDLNGGEITGNIYGGGNFGVVKGNSIVEITDATVRGSAYAGGNGSTATLEGNTSITIDGNSVIGSPDSIAPFTGSVFGGGNQAFTGNGDQNDSTSTVNIVGATIYGNVYGGANTSVIYGNTIVNIGSENVEDSSLKVDDIYIKGHIFGGGEANAEASDKYDWDFISVTEGTLINVDALNHSSFQIDGSFYGGGNASSASGDSYLYIKNYGEMGAPKKNVSIQRVKYAYINHSSMILKGAIDRANDYKDELFSISRVPELHLQNNSELYLETGANLLEAFYSEDGSGNLAQVTIDKENHQVTKNVNNRLYMFEGKNLNIATDEQVTEYGLVRGMTFFGLFNYNFDNTVNTGNYHFSKEAGDSLSWAGEFTRGGYVVGHHDTNHDIKVNGFYSNFINKETLVNDTDYIEPTPSNSVFYMWYVGENVLEYNVDLEASKYSTLGSVELSFLEFTEPNTSFEVLNFDTSELADGIHLVDKNDIPRIAANVEDANHNFGLSMEASNTGWLTTGKTNFYTSNPTMRGTTYYEGENSTTVPTMLFYLYHSKNLDVKQDLGTVRISIMAITKVNALSSVIKRLVINVNMSTLLFNTIEYEGAMTPGDKYELFASTSNNITTKSKFSAYYALYAENQNIYKTGYHRALTSNFVLPEKTKITMIDFANHQTEYYYHIITAEDVANATSELARENEVSYPLSMFQRMGGQNDSQTYSDADMNQIYFDGENSSEEFIFIVDFGDTNINQNQLGNSLLIEMQNQENESVISFLGIERSRMVYNLYEGNDSILKADVSITDNPLYIGHTDIFDVQVSYINDSISNVGIVDTQYFDSKLGLQVSVLNHEGSLVSGTDLVGTYFEMDNNRYYPDISGITHIKLSNKVGNTQKWLLFHSDNSSLPSGEYTFKFEVYGSLDGIYYGDQLPKEELLNVTVINSTYGLNPVLNDDNVILSSKNDKLLKFSIGYESVLENPNIRLAMYRRKYDEIYDTDYELVDLKDFLDQTLFATSNPMEYLLIDKPGPQNDYSLILKSELQTGTYRLAFRLYDGDTLIGEIIRYIIVK
ncbi:MAG: hypothetical protein IJ704_00155 [Bacilli bacterium]|nr:hypothetical protein [Bacilli bacterium]